MDDFPMIFGTASANNAMAAQTKSGKSSVEIWDRDLQSVSFEDIGMGPWSNAQSAKWPPVYPSTIVYFKHWTLLSTSR
jgi:hypothetical protein